MSYGINSLSTRTKLIAGALALVMAGMSHASGTIVGGGATLPSLGYVGTGAANPNTPQVFGSSVDAHSLFGAALGTGVSYCLTGSGAGKNILAGIANNSVQNACPTDSTGTLHGFGAPAVSRTDLTQPNFAGADAPLSSTDFSNYIGAHGNNNPVEFPAVAGAVAIAFNLKDNTGATVTGSEVNFTDTQLCKIFSGQVTVWNDPQLTGQATGSTNAYSLPAGHSIPANPINVQYRSDGSGTTFSFSNHLAAACNTTTNPIETSQNFFSTSASPYVVQNFFGGSSHPALPSNWTGSSGNPAVARAINATSNSIGYVEAANALHTVDSNGNPIMLQFADVGGKSPTADFGSALTLVALSVQANAAIGSTNNTNGTPTVVALSNPNKALTTGSNACIVLVKPADYAVPGSTPGFINPTGNYPIVAVSYLLGNTVGNGTDQANTQTLATAPYNSTIRSSVTTIGGTTGLQFINPNTAFNTSTNPSQVSNCYGL